LNTKLNYNKLVSLFPPLATIEYNQLLWGQLACISRSFGLLEDIENLQTIRAMVPLAGKPKDQARSYKPQCTT